MQQPIFAVGLWRGSLRRLAREVCARQVPIWYRLSLATPRPAAIGFSMRPPRLNFKVIIMSNSKFYRVNNAHTMALIDAKNIN